MDTMIWLLFAILAGSMLVADIASHRHGNPTLANAVGWSVAYLGVALVFAGVLAVTHGAAHATTFLTGYTLEKILSVDNLFAFSAVFAYFGIKAEHQHRILHYGVIGAVVFRLVFTVAGLGLLQFVGWPVELAFAVLIGWSAWAMWRAGDGDEDVDHGSRWYVRWVKKVWPVLPNAEPSQFFVRASSLNGTMVIAVTPAFLCLIAVEITDVMFAFDSVPAVLAVTQDMLLVYPAMVFAILGLRSLYFVLEALKGMLVHLEKAVIVILGFIALKIGAHALFGFKVDPAVSLAVVLGLLGVGVVSSLIFPGEAEADGAK